MGRGAVVALLALGASAGAAHAARITASPHVALLDRQIAIQVTGLKPRQAVTIESIQPGYPYGTWTGRLTYRADAHGRVDAGPRAMQLFSLMTGQYDTIADGQKPVQLLARVGGRTVARTTVVRRARAPGVRSYEATRAADGFVGRYYTPPAPTGKPAVIVIGGSEGGEPVVWGELLASHGFPALALAYFDEPGLPQTLTNIPLEYFRTALQWRARQPNVDSARIELVGGSRGGEGALLVAATYPSLVHAVAALAPCSFVNPGIPPTFPPSPAWTLDGKAVPFSTATRYPGNPPQSPDAVIPVERISGPVFLVGGGADGIWPSAAYVRTIVARLAAHGRHDVTSLVYPRAGHLAAAPPFYPWSAPQAGGSPQADAAAQAATWPKLLRFLAAR